MYHGRVGWYVFLASLYALEDFFVAGLLSLHFFRLHVIFKEFNPPPAFVNETQVHDSKKYNAHVSILKR